MRKLLTAASLVIMILAPTWLHAQVHLGGQLSFADDFDLGIGARATFGLPTPAPLEIVGTIDYFFPDDVPGVDISYWEINANLVYLFRIPAPSVTPYAGGGLNFSRISANVDLSEFGGVEVPGIAASNSEMGLNLLGGARFNLGSLTPFAELRFELGGGEQFVISGGALFRLGP